MQFVASIAVPAIKKAASVSEGRSVFQFNLLPAGLHGVVVNPIGAAGLGTVAWHMASRACCLSLAMPLVFCACCCQIQVGLKTCRSVKEMFSFI